MGYAHERLGRSISYLNGDGDKLRDRLTRAATELCFEGSDGLNDENRDELEAIREAVTAADNDGEGAIVATISCLDDDEAYELSARIHALYWRTRNA